MLNFRVNEDDVFTGDTLFKGSVGGVHAPASTSYDDIKTSIMDVLMKLPPATRLHPGHTDPTTVGDEWEQNAFIRVWRGLDPEGTDPCTVWEREATLVLWAPDYDGGHKAWIRWADTGEDDIVPGSQVVRPARARRLRPQTGHWPGPDCSYSIAARMSCSASGACEGSPLPPIAAHVCDRELVLAVVHAVRADGGRITAGLALGDRLEVRRNRDRGVGALLLRGGALLGGPPFRGAGLLPKLGLVEMLRGQLRGDVAGHIGARLRERKRYGRCDCARAQRGHHQAAHGKNQPPASGATSLRRSRAGANGAGRGCQATKNRRANTGSQHFLYPAVTPLTLRAGLRWRA